MPSIPCANAEYYALVDCNNFYASCERLFNPAMRGKPVVVLSNNDGCVVARSEEAKAVGVPMCAPFSKIKELVRHYGVKVFSSNYALYGDMSGRVMTILSGFCPELERYSIDEAFLLLRGLNASAVSACAVEICNTVYGHTGLPVSIGVARTKTLAKLANHLAKRVFKTGVYCLADDVDDIMRAFPVGDIWGVGHRRQKSLNLLGIYTAYDLKNMPDDLIRRELSVIGLRTAWELRGIPCIQLETATPDKKAVTCSRMFGTGVTDFASLEAAVLSYINRACVKLRSQNLIAGYLQVHIESSRFKKPYYQSVVGTSISPPTAFTPHVSQSANKLLRRVFRPGVLYNRAGVLLSNLSRQEKSQKYFLGSEYAGSSRQKLMEAIDRYNANSPDVKIQLAAEGHMKSWPMKQEMKSPRFTTHWKELLVVKI